MWFGWIVIYTSNSSLLWHDHSLLLYSIIDSEVFTVCLRMYQGAKKSKQKFLLNISFPNVKSHRCFISGATLQRNVFRDITIIQNWSYKYPDPNNFRLIMIYDICTLNLEKYEFIKNFIFSIHTKVFVNIFQYTKIFINYLDIESGFLKVHPHKQHIYFMTWKNLKCALQRIYLMTYGGKFSVPIFRQIFLLEFFWFHLNFFISAKYFYWYN